MNAPKQPPRDCGDSGFDQSDGNPRGQDCGKDSNGGNFEHNANTQRGDDKARELDSAAIAERLVRAAPAEQVAILRDIATRESVSGYTLACIEMIASPDPEVRSWAAEVLEDSILPDRNELRRLTTRMIASNNGEVCYWVATMLGRMGEEASSAVDALAICARDSRYLPARERSVWALRQIGPASAAAVSVLEEVAEDAPPRLSRMARHAIDAIRSNAA